MMKSIIQLLARNYFNVVLLVLALMVGALNILPPVLIWYNLSSSNSSFLLMQQNVYRDEFFQYMPRAREVFDGHFPPTGVYANESGPTPLNSLPPLLFSVFILIYFASKCSVKIDHSNSSLCAYGNFNFSFNHCYFQFGNAKVCHLLNMAPNGICTSLRLGKHTAFGFRIITSLFNWATLDQLACTSRIILLLHSA